jgi:rhodanese-related sulfurtransferase
VPKGIDVARAQRLIKRGAQLVDVLPHSIFTQEHLPGAVSLPLETMSSATASEIDRARAVVVYCFDQH